MKVSIFEPFIAMCNSSYILLILPIFYMLMIADFPKRGGFSLFMHIRVDSVTWLLGELLFLVLSSLTIIGFLMLSGIVLIGNSGEFNLNYSDAITKFITYYPDKKDDYIMGLVPDNLYNQMDLGWAMVHSILLLVLYFVILGLIIMFFTLINRKILGIVAAGAMIFLGVIACGYNSILKWFLPMAHTIVWTHYTEFMSKQVYGIRNTYIYMFVWVVVMCVICALFRKKYQHKNHILF